MLSPEQVARIKSEIADQITNFPEDKRAAAKEQMDSMDAGQLEDFLRQNNLLKSDEDGTRCVFCSIFSGDIASQKVAENEGAVAVLEINPVSRGHAIVIPVEHEIPDLASGKPSEHVSSLIQKTREKLEKLNPREIVVSDSSVFGHTVFNLIPIYANETPESERHKASPEELSGVMAELERNAEEKEIEGSSLTELPSSTIIPRRIP